MGLNSTFRMFVNNSNCGYVIWRFADTLNSTRIAARTQFTGLFNTKPVEECSELTLAQVQQEYDEFHNPGQPETPVQQPAASSQDKTSSVKVAVACTISVVLVLVLIAAAVKLRKSRQQVGDESYHRLEQLLGRANKLLDEVLQGTTLQQGLPLPVFNTY
jgi:hypothetical protein